MSSWKGNICCEACSSQITTNLTTFVFRYHLFFLYKIIFEIKKKDVTVLFHKIGYEIAKCYTSPFFLPWFFLNRQRKSWYFFPCFQITVTCFIHGSSLLSNTSFGKRHTLHRWLIVLLFSIYLHFRNLVYPVGYFLHADQFPVAHIGLIIISEMIIVPFA